MKRIVTIAALLGQPAFALDDCLVGVWAADGAGMAAAMASSTGSQVQHVSGQTTLTITASGTVEMQAAEIVFAMTMENIPPMQIAVNGYSRGTMTTQASSYTATANDYSLVGSGEVMGQRMDIPITSASGGRWGTSSGNFACAGNSLNFTTNQPGSIPPSFVRVR